MEKDIRDLKNDVASVMSDVASVKSDVKEVKLAICGNKAMNIPGLVGSHLDNEQSIKGLNQEIGTLKEKLRDMYWKVIGLGLVSSGLITIFWFLAQLAMSHFAKTLTP